MSTSLRHEPIEPSEANKVKLEQTKFARPDEQAMVQLDNMSPEKD